MKQRERAWWAKHWPKDVVCVINGRAITTAEIRRGKLEDQRRNLMRVRKATEPIIVPCHVWVFYNDTFFYGGWWLYIRTHTNEFQITPNGQHYRLIVPIMRLFPCGGVEPDIDNFRQWKAAFAEKYNHPTRKRPTSNGLAIANAKISEKGRNGRLLEVLPRG